MRRGAAAAGAGAALGGRRNAEGGMPADVLALASGLSAEVGATFSIGAGAGGGLARHGNGCAMLGAPGVG